MGHVFELVEIRWNASILDRPSQSPLRRKCGLAIVGDRVSPALGKGAKRYFFTGN
jgi:hypothetical protein